MSTWVYVRVYKCIYVHVLSVRACTCMRIHVRTHVRTTTRNSERGGICMQAFIVCAPRRRVVY